MATAKNTRDMITAPGPKYPNREIHGGAPNTVQFNSMTDGTTTIVQITLYGEPIGTGVAKRRSTDPRNTELGMVLAMTRAFTDAATRYAGYVDQLLNGEYNDRDHPSVKAANELRKLNKRDAIRRKNLRREKARRAHREVWGWDHNDRPEDLSKARD